jgi:hypothetical protein
MVMLAWVEEKAVDELVDAECGVKRQATQMNVLRKNLDCAHAKGRSKDGALRDLITDAAA